MADAWAIVIAAKGERDEGEYAIGFADQAKEFFDDIDDEDACEGTQLAADAAGLNFQATLLATYFKVEPPASPDDDVYGQVVKAGNTLLKTAGVDKVQFITDSCHGRVDETEACTALS